MSALLGMRFGNMAKNHGLQDDQSCANRRHAVHPHPKVHSTTHIVISEAFLSVKSANDLDNEF